MNTYKDEIKALSSITRAIASGENPSTIRHAPAYAEERKALHWDEEEK